MEVKNYIYKEYTIELYEHPIYHDFEYVLKKDNKVISASSCKYQYLYDAEKEAQKIIDLI
jgi:hypothetical protein